MSSLKSLSSYAGLLGLLTLSGCLDSGSGKAQAPIRPIDISRTIVTAANPTNAEVAAGQSISVRLADKRGAGIAGVQPRITLVDGSGSVPVGVTGGSCSVSSGTGLANCSVSASNPGTYFVKVLSPSAYVTTTTVGFVQKIASLKFTTQPSCAGCAVGTSFSTAVQILDRAGNPITTGADSIASITLSINSGGGTLSGTLTRPAVGGTATFPGLSVTKAAALTLAATSGAASGLSSSFTPVPGGPHHLKFTTQPPAKVASNINFSPAPVVGIFDAYENPVTNVNCTVSIVGAGAAGTIIGSAVKVTNAGVADYTNSGLRYNISTASTGFRLRANPSGTNCSSGVAYADSNLFEVTLSGVPNQMALMVNPGTAALNQVWPVQPRIQILDIDGKPVTDDSATVVTMSIVGYTGVNSGTTQGTLVGPTSVQALNGVVSFANMFITYPAAQPATNYEGNYEYLFTAVSPGITFSQSVRAVQLVTADGNRGPFSLQFMDQPQSGSIGQVLPPVRVRKVDTNGYLNFTDNSTDVDLNLVGSGGFDLGGATTRTARLVNGIATFSGLRIVKPTASSADPTGVKSYTTNFNGSATPNYPSSSFAISSFSSPAQLRFIGSINENASVGNAPWSSPPVVHIQDSANNTVTNDSTTKVTLSIAQYTNAGGVPTLMSAVTRQAVGGIVTFDGMYTSETNVTNIVLSATSDPVLTPGQSVTFNGNRAVAASLRFVKSPVAGYKSDTAGSCTVTATSGQNDAISVEILDAGGQRVSADNSTVINLTCTGCTITAGNSATVQSGVATFGSLRTDQSHNGVVLRATSGSLPALDSSSFNIPVCNP